MKSLVFSHTPTWRSHHAESIEIALSEQELGNDVMFLSCTGSLATCPANSSHKEHICKVCRSQTAYTKSKVLPGEVKFMDLDIQESDHAIQEFSSIDSLKKFELHTVPFGNMVYSTLTSELNDSFFDVIKYRDKINKLIKNAVGLYEYGLKLIKSHKIEHVYIWNGRRSCDGPLAYAAKNSDIEYTTFISGARYNSLLTRHNSLTVHDIPAAKMELKQIIHKMNNSANRFSIVKGAVSYFDYASGGSKDNTLNYLGYYQFSQGFNKASRHIINKKSDKKVIAVFTGTYSEFAGVPGYDNPDNFCNNFYEGVSFLQENLHHIPNAELQIRWHPNSRHLNGNERDKLANIIERGNQINNVQHIPPESNFNTYDLIDSCDVCVGFGTSVSVESCLYGKPAIFLGNNMFEDLDCFYKPNSYEELIELLNSTLTVKNFDHALAWGYYFSNFGNREYEHLEQRQNNYFYYKGKRVASLVIAIRMYLGKIRRLVNSIKLNT
jgi:hypothetical protein